MSLGVGQKTHSNCLTSAVLVLSTAKHLDDWLMLVKENARTFIVKPFPPLSDGREI